MFTFQYISLQPLHQANAEKETNSDLNLDHSDEVGSDISLTNVMNAFVLNSLHVPHVFPVHSTKQGQATSASAGMTKVTPDHDS